MTDQERIVQEYGRRAGEARYRARYSLLNPATLHVVQSRERAILALLRRHGFTELSSARMLDVGCGGGFELLRWLGYGCDPAHCAGIDLLTDRTAEARRRLPAAVDVRRGDAAYLPYPDAAFDIVTQYVVFSSILDPALRRAVAGEMRRVLRPNGLIVWYDFWLNPGNPQTRGVRLGEVRRLFPGCRYDARLITLAPPLTRRIAPISWTLASLLEWLPLRTHWLIGIRRV